MGLVINPVGYRIGYSQYWVDSWYLHRMYYPVFVHKSIEMKLLLEYCLRRRLWIKSFWIYSHMTFYYFNNKFYINVFFYDGVPETFFTEEAGKFRYRVWKRLRLKSVFRKRQVLDKQYYATRWWFLCYLFNFKIEHFQYEDINWAISKKTAKKIKNLRAKYGKDWIAREELAPQQFLTTFSLFDKYNKMGIMYFNKLYKLYVSRKLQKTIEILKKKPRYYYTNDFAKLKKISRSHKAIFFFFSYIDKIFKQLPMYPYKFFSAKSLKHQIKLYRLYFVFRPFWLQLSKFYELLFIYINIDSKISIYYLSNPHLSAQYISRYIMTTLRYKFDYRDTLNPIKKTLNRILFIKTWTNTNKMKFDIWNRYINFYNIYLNNRKNLYRSLFVFNLKMFDKVKVINYLNKIQILNKYKLKYINNKKLKFKTFNIGLFIKNLRYVRNNILLNNNKILMKKKKFKIKRFKNINILNKLFFFYRKSLFKLFKIKILNNLLFNKKRTINLYKQKFIFLKLKYLLKIKKKNYKFKKIIKLFNNFQSKYIPLKRKIHKIRNLVLKLKYLKLKKLNLIKISLINIFFILLNLKRSYILNNGSFYNYMNSFDKSIAFTSVHRIQRFWLKRRLRKIVSKVYSVHWKKNINLLFLNQKFKLVSKRKYNTILQKFVRVKYFNLNKIKYNIKLRNINVLKKNKLYYFFLFIKKYLKFKFYNFFKNKFMKFILNYDRKYLLNLKKRKKIRMIKYLKKYIKIIRKKSIKKFIKRNIDKLKKNYNKKYLLKKEIQLSLMKFNYKKKYIYFFKNISNFFLFKYNIFFNLFNIKKLIYIKNIFLFLKNFNNRFIFFSISQNKIKIFTKYYKQNLKNLKKHDNLFLNFLRKKKNILISGVKKTKKWRIKKKKNKIIKILNNMLLTTQQKEKRDFIEKKLRNYYDKFFDINLKKFILRSKILKIKKIRIRLKKKAKKINRKINNILLILRSKKSKKKKWFKNMYKIIRKRKNLKRQLKKYIYKKLILYFKSRKLRLKKYKLISFLKVLIKTQFKLYKFLSSLNKTYDKGAFLFYIFKKNRKKKKNKKKNKLKYKLFVYRKFLLFREWYNKNLQLRKQFKRGYFVIFIDSFINNYSKNYLPFIFNLDLYGNYLQRLFNLPLLKYQIKSKTIKKTNLQVTPLINKFRKLKYLQGDRINVLYGYKFHFSGRFTRKQKAASWWYIKGSIPASSMSYDVDYGYFTVSLRYSACTLKVWLYKNKKISPKYGIKMV